MYSGGHSHGWGTIYDYNIVRFEMFSNWKIETILFFVLYTEHAHCLCLNLRTTFSIT